MQSNDWCDILINKKAAFFSVHTSRSVLFIDESSMQRSVVYSLFFFLNDSSIKKKYIR